MIPYRMAIKMDISLKKLSLATADDFFHFFDRDAFSDHEEWAGCYCLESHLKKEENDALWGKNNERREKAENMIQEGFMTGYLIYDGTNVVGWCNAGDKADYYPICNDAHYFTDNAEKGRIRSYTVWI